MRGTTSELARVLCYGDDAGAAASAAIAAWRKGALREAESSEPAFR